MRDLRPLIVDAVVVLAAMLLIALTGCAPDTGPGRASHAPIIYEGSSPPCPRGGDDGGQPATDGQSQGQERMPP